MPGTGRIFLLKSTNFVEPGNLLFKYNFIASFNFGIASDGGYLPQSSKKMSNLFLINSGGPSWGSPIDIFKTFRFEFGNFPSNSDVRLPNIQPFKTSKSWFIIIIYLVKT